MSLSLQINREDARPVYQQIASQIKNQISVGQLPPGTRLPSVRHMAQVLDVNRLTVHNAYSELQADGWVEATVGRGTYVLAHAQPMSLLSSVSAQLSPDSVLSSIHPIRQIPTLRSLAYAEPDMVLAPVDELMGAVFALRRDAASLLRYDSPQGDPALRVELAALAAERGVEAMPDDVIVTSGAMQALSLAAQALARAGDVVLVEEPTYLGVIHIIKTFGMRPISIPRDDEGPRLDVLENIIQRENPRFFYVMPSFQNPTGLSTTQNRRRELLNLAARFQLPLVEDDVYGLLAYDEPPTPALKSNDPHDLVVYVNSLSKVLAPGLRVGCLITSNPHLRKRVLSLRHATDMCGPALIQRALANFLHHGRLKAHLKRMIPVYRTRRDALLQGLERHMPEGVTWTRPQGGFTAWVTLPQDNMLAIYQAALHHDLAFTPGEAFLTEARTNRHLRLCFGNQPAEDLGDILALLGDLIRQHDDLATHGSQVTPIWTPLA